MGSPMDDIGERVRERVGERVRERLERRRGVYGVRIGTTSSTSGRMIFGLVILTLGVLWTLDNLGLIDSGDVLQWWPMALVAFGVAKILGLGTRRNVVWGSTFTVAGLWMLAGNFDLIHTHLLSLWPLMLIAIGITIILRAGAPRRTTGNDPSDRVNTFAFWSGVG